MAVCPGLPVKGVAVLLGNDVAGGKVPHPGVLPKPTLEQRKRNNQLRPSRRKLYPACAFTHTQTRNYADVYLTDATDFRTNSRTDLDGSSPSQVRMGEYHKSDLERPGRPRSPDAHSYALRKDVTHLYAHVYPVVLLRVAPRKSH
ncbi:uncharacterized protein LOC112156289 [Oryzias melastigma]|uniref:uncharacterized protein LOC112156289 n=1 Tax=Oryzias melastigma TaxID=30732 RepID=UPI00168CCB15|nr:uncharacterized protein LOC112156289 [Oryzias melastigma]